MTCIEKDDAIRYGIAYVRATDRLGCEEASTFTAFIEGYALALKDANVDLSNILTEEIPAEMPEVEVDE